MKQRGTMTEAVWLAAHYSRPMLKYWKDTASQRKMRLFAVACCRRV